MTWGGDYDLKKDRPIKGEKIRTYPPSSHTRINYEPGQYPIPFFKW